MPIDDVLEGISDGPKDAWKRLCSAHDLEIPANESSYKNVVFEEKVKYIDNDSSTKELLTYDKSDERIQQKNSNARHARPSEAFGLIIDCLENKVNDEKLLKVKEDMLKSYGEWLSCAFERQENTLIVYLDPEGITWNGSTYVKNKDFRFADKKEFDITGIASRKWIDLNKFPEEFIKYIYGRIFSDLPTEMKEGGRRAQVYLPSDGIFWPVARGDYVNNYGVYGYFCYGWASRAVAIVGAPK